MNISNMKKKQGVDSSVLVKVYAFLTEWNYRRYEQSKFQ